MRRALVQPACPTLHSLEHSHMVQLTQNSLKPHVAVREASSPLGEDWKLQEGKRLAHILKPGSGEPEHKLHLLEVDR